MNRLFMMYAATMNEYVSLTRQMRVWPFISCFLVILYVFQGDSGGPLVCLEGDRWVQYGVVSWGWMGVCGAQHFPAAYARVSAYLSWIEAKINENSS